MSRQTKQSGGTIWKHTCNVQK